MAEMTLAEKFKMVDAASKKINEKAGKVVVGRVGVSEEIRDSIAHKFIPTPSLNVNAAIGGGWPIGNITVVSGDSDSGKEILIAC